MPSIELQTFNPAQDLPLLEHWLESPDVSRWWGEPAQALEELARHPAGDAALIVADGRPVGYLQWQRPARAALQEAGLDDLPADLIDVDIMIGEPGMQGRGIGPAALRRLFTHLAQNGVAMVGLATALSNRHALSAYAKAGLQPYRDFFEQGEDYRYLTLRLNDPGLPPAHHAASA